jgi:hypothetical protein
MKAIPCEKLPRNWRSHTTLCNTLFTEQRKLALTRIERGVGGPGAQLSKRTSTVVSSLRNRRLTSPQLVASLNSTRKTPVSMSTVKMRLWDAGPLGRVPLWSVCVPLPILIFSFYWPVWDLAFSLQLCLEGQHLHCWRWDWCFPRYYLMKLPVEVLWGVLNHVVTKKIYFIFAVLQSSHPLPWWQLCTLLASSQCILINMCAFLKVHLWNFFPS